MSNIKSTTEMKVPHGTVQNQNQMRSQGETSSKGYRRLGSVGLILHFSHIAVALSISNSFAFGVSFNIMI